MGMIGFCRILTILFFLCCTMQLTKEEREELLALVPVQGSAMAVAGILCLWILLIGMGGILLAGSTLAGTGRE
ncbi:MAG: hypothetical protein K2M46_10015 [Lachnospiraceae bacterium]|nr:hypothetical protein [Lachnospiraceae bacterium]